MTLKIPADILAQIRSHGQAAYPDEGAGFLLGSLAVDDRTIISILPAENSREQAARHNRYQLGPEQFRQAEETAARLGLELLGVFHSHPDHPAEPSEFDRQWALPWFSYVITSIEQGRAVVSRSWRLAEDRAAFFEEAIVGSGVTISEPPKMINRLIN